MREQRGERLELGPLAGVTRLRLFRDALVPPLDVIAIGDEQLELERLEVVGRARVGEKPSSTARIASTWRRLPSSAGPVPGTSTTRIAAGVTFRAETSAASRGRRSSAIAAMPTFGFSVTDAYAVISAPARVSALNSVVLPLFGSPTIPTSSAIEAPG